MKENLKPEDKELAKPALQGEVLYSEYIERIRSVCKRLGFEVPDEIKYQKVCYDKIGKK